MLKLFCVKVIYKINQLYQGYVRRDPAAILALDWIKQNKSKDFRHRYPLAAGDVIFDCGGFKGDWTARMLSLYPDCRYYVFEIVPDYFDRVQRRFSNQTNVKVFNCGLGDVERDVNIVISDVASGHFLQPTRGPVVRGKIRNAAEFVREQNLEQIHLLKMNIEGGEYELLETLIKARLVEKCRDIQIQFHDFAEWCEARREEIRRNLSRTHYLTYDYAWNFENWRCNDAKIPL